MQICYTIYCNSTNKVLNQKVINSVKIEFSYINVANPNILK